MKSDKVITALEVCKKELVSAIKEHLEGVKYGSVQKLDVPIVGVDDDGYPRIETITEVELDDDGDIRICLDTYDKQYWFSVDMFNVGELADLIDAL